MGLGDGRNTLRVLVDNDQFGQYEVHGESAKFRRSAPFFFQLSVKISQHYPVPPGNYYNV